MYTTKSAMLHNYENCECLQSITPLVSPALHGKRLSFNSLVGGFTFPGLNADVLLPSFRRPELIPQIYLPLPFLIAAKGMKMPSGK